MSERGTPRVSYTTAFKLRVIAYAVSNGNRAAGRQFSVDESCVRRWKLQRERLLCVVLPRPRLLSMFEAWSLSIRSFRFKRVRISRNISTSWSVLK